MKSRFYIVLFIGLLIFGCSNGDNNEVDDNSQSISEQTDIGGIGAIDDEFRSKSLDTLEEDLEHIENI